MSEPRAIPVLPPGYLPPPVDEIRCDWVHPIAGLRCLKERGHDDPHEMDVVEAAEWFNSGDAAARLLEVMFTTEGMES